MVVSEAEAAYQKALRGFEENLNSKQMKEIQRPTSLDELCGLAGEISRKHERKEDRKTMRIYEKLNSARDRMRPFDILLEGLCDSAPAGGKFIWGAVRFTFQLVEDNHATFEAVLDFFTGIGDKLSIIQTELASFRESVLVSSIAEKIFAALLDFWMQAIKTYRTMHFGLLNPTRIPLKLKFERLQKELDGQIALMKDAAHAQHHHNFEQFSSGLQNHLQDELDEQIFDWIGAPNYLLDLNKATKKRHNGTCEWILNKNAYHKYISPTEPVNFLVTYGIPGAGKTILSSFVIKHTTNLTPSIQTSDDIPSFVIFHFFKADDDSKNTPITSLRSLLHQIYEFALDAQMGDIKSIFQAASRKRNVDYDDLWSLFTSIVQSNLLRLTVVLDALDECVGMKSFAKDVLALLQGENLKIFATSRKTGDHVSVLHGSKVETIQMTQEDVKRDIASFVRHKVGKMYNLSSPRFKRLRTLVIDELSKKDNHKGMFLWAYLMCKEIGNQGKVGQIQRLLQELPQDIRAVYIKILTRLNEKPAANQTFIQHVLRWVVGSIRPLKWGELDQALEIDRFRNEYYEDDDDYGEMSIYSRRDVVKVCGSLVHYTGLDDGDVIGLIHLSTREFLKGSARQMEGLPKVLEKYLVNDKDVSLAIALRCLNVLNSPSTQFAKYSRQLYRRKTTLRPPGTEEDPLFEYSVVYWPEYIDTLQANDGEPLSKDNMQNLSDLGILLTQFITGPFYVPWLEEYIRICGVELSSYTARRLLKVELPNISSKVNQLTLGTARSLQNFSETLERFPAAVRFCIPTLRRVGKHKPQSLHMLTSSKDESEEHQPLPRGGRGWMAYDHRSRSLFMTDHSSEFMRVIRRRTDGNIAFRPAVARGQLGKDQAWITRSATLKQDATYLAATFSHSLSGAGPEPFYKTVCWSVSNSRDVNGAVPWAQILVIDDTESSIFRIGVTINRGALVTFGENNTLICPGGIWDLATEEKLPCPDSIWKPDEPERVFQTCFSTHRAARIRGQRYLEILELFDGENHKAGDLVGSYEFFIYLYEGDAKDIDGLQIRKFSPQGDKVIMAYLEPLPEQQGNDDDGQASTALPFRVRVVCFIVDSDGVGHTVELDIGSIGLSKYTIRDCEFTADGQSIVGAVYAEEGGINEGGVTVKLWSLQRTRDGYESFAETVVLWKSLDPWLTFALTPPLSTERMGGILIGLSDGRLVKRSLTQHWTDEEDSELGKSQYLNNVGGKTLSRIDLTGNTVYMVAVPKIKGPTPKLVIEAWSIEDKPIPRFPTIRYDLPADEANNSVSMSPNGEFVAAKEKLFHVSAKGVLNPLPFLIEASNDAGLQFDHGNHRFANVEEQDGVATIEIYEVEANETLRCLASLQIEVEEDLKPYDVKVAFAGTQNLVFAYTFWTEFMTNKTRVAVVEDGEVTTVDICDEYLQNLSFSQCGRYIYGVDSSVLGKPEWPELYPVGSILQLGESGLSHDEHPTIIERDFCYVNASYMYRIWPLDRSGVVCLDKKHIDASDEDVRSRYIGVIPDLNLGRQENKLFAIWPQDPMDEVKLLIKPDGRTGHPIVIKTGIISEDLLDESEWLDNNSLLS